MRRTILALAALTGVATSALAQTPPPASPPPALAPSEIVAAAPASDWLAIAPSDLLVMTLAPDPRGGAGRTGERRVVIQLMPAPFSQGWIANIRTLASAHWWDGLSINRVQDNYVVQWGDADGEDPAKARALPSGLRVIDQSEYETAFRPTIVDNRWEGTSIYGAITTFQGHLPRPYPQAPRLADPYATVFGFAGGFPLAMTTSRTDTPTAITIRPDKLWPVHCYGMVGVGRDLPPNTGNGAELYAVIGHAPRHLDRNIALVGRVIEGMEHLSSLPRGTEALGVYATAAERTGIVSIRLASELPAAEQPHFEYLSTESATFARYADARANRHDPFFIVPAGGADICNIPVPVRRVVAGL